ncbi:MAG: hypothetical protein JWP97_4360 [Labilithrix sp.]|nr:hypothetical protein [Labilithrix sp.]
MDFRRFCTIALLLVTGFVAGDAEAKGSHGGGRSSGSHSSGRSSAPKSSSPKSSSPKASSSKPSTAPVRVGSYVKPSTGTVVQSHARTLPNKTQKDNWSAKPNTNPNTGKPGTKTLTR